VSFVLCAAGVDTAIGRYTHRTRDYSSSFIVHHHQHIITINYYQQQIDLFCWFFCFLDSSRAYVSQWSLIHQTLDSRAHRRPSLLARFLQLFMFSSCRRNQTSRAEVTSVFAFLHSGYVCFRTATICERALQLHMADGFGCVRISPCPAVGPGTNIPKRTLLPRVVPRKCSNVWKAARIPQQFADGVLVMAVTTSEANHNGKMLRCRQGPLPLFTALLIQYSYRYLFWFHRMMHMPVLVNDATHHTVPFVFWYLTISRKSDLTYGKIRSFHSRGLSAARRNSAAPWKSVKVSWLSRCV